jgi:hypothetical protein
MNVLAVGSVKRSALPGRAHAFLFFLIPDQVNHFLAELVDIPANTSVRWIQITTGQCNAVAWPHPSDRQKFAVLVMTLRKHERLGRVRTTLPLKTGQDVMLHIDMLAAVKVPTIAAHKANLILFELVAIMDAIHGLGRARHGKQLVGRTSQLKGIARRVLDLAGIRCMFMHKDCSSPAAFQDTVRVLQRRGNGHDTIPHHEGILADWSLARQWHETQASGAIAAAVVAVHMHFLERHLQGDPIREQGSTNGLHDTLFIGKVKIAVRRHIKVCIDRDLAATILLNAGPMHTEWTTAICNQNVVAAGRGNFRLDIVHECLDLRNRMLNRNVQAE